jgi:serine/threonine-protein kinase
VVVLVADQSNQSMPRVGDVIAGKYTIEQLIGVGGMGAVFSALHKFTGKRVALKWMLPELARDSDAVQRFMREAHASGRINHPNVVDVYDVGQHEDSFFLVMEYLHGEPLTSALNRRDMTPSETLELLLPAMRGVAAAHRQGVVHRDLKPDNIFLSYEEDGVRRQPKVLDFGISKLSNDGSGIDMRLTRTGAVVGTPYYMSPEQIRGLAGLDKRADIYSFGVILYESLTGRVPFHADTYGALVLEIATGTAPPPHELVPGLPVELAMIVMRAMAREAGQRFQDMESLVRALEPYAGPQAVRMERRDPTGAAIDLEATRISAPIRTPRPASIMTRGPASGSPRITSTPFAAEVAEQPRRFGLTSGPVLFVVAAIAIVGGIWFFTREPEAAAPEQVVIPPSYRENPRPIASPATAATAPVLPPTTPISAPTVVPVTPAPAPTLHAADTTNEAAALAERNLHPKPLAAAHKRNPQRLPSPPEAEAPVPAQAPAPTPPRNKTPRSGTLTVDEF